MGSGTHIIIQPFRAREIPITKGLKQHLKTNKLYYDKVPLVRPSLELTDTLRSYLKMIVSQTVLFIIVPLIKPLLESTKMWS